MRYVVLVVMVLAAVTGKAQMTGEIKDDGRKMLTPFNYLLKGNQEGVIVVEIAVNIDGNVTSVQVIRNESTIVSIPTHMMVKEKIKTLKFEKGYHYPKFHRARLRVIIEKEE